LGYEVAGIGPQRQWPSPSASRAWGCERFSISAHDEKYLGFESEGPQVRWSVEAVCGERSPPGSGAARRWPRAHSVGSRRARNAGRSLNWAGFRYSYRVGGHAWPDHDTSLVGEGVRGPKPGLDPTTCVIPAGPLWSERQNSQPAPIGATPLSLSAEALRERTRTHCLMHLKPYDRQSHQTSTTITTSATHDGRFCPAPSKSFRLDFWHNIYLTVLRSGRACCGVRFEACAYINLTSWEFRGPAHYQTQRMV